MPRHANFPDSAIQSAKAALSNARNIREFRKAQAVVLSACYGLTKEQIADATGVSRSQVGIFQKQARSGESQKTVGSSGGRRRQMMSLEEEKAFLKPWEERTSSAGVVIVKPIHHALEERLGRRVNISQTYRLLARNGWRKIAPDSIHPKADLEKQQAWKKNFRKRWPNAWQAPPRKENGRV